MAGEITIEDIRRMKRWAMVHAAPTFIGPDGKECYIWDVERQESVTTYTRAWELGCDV